MAEELLSCERPTNPDPLAKNGPVSQHASDTESNLRLSDSFQRERMRAWLESQQWIVQEAANGREALHHLQQSKPDLILLDLMMPEMDGFQVVATLQKERAGGTFQSS